jgi:steroid delta-isomerase-like uncharacterized protein
MEKEGQTVSDNIEIIKRFEFAFRAADQATIDELCDPALIDHNPAPDHEPTLAGFKEKVAYFKAVFPDLDEDLQDIIATGDTVATRWVLTGSMQQEFMGILANGQEIRVEGMNFYRIKAGRVTDIWTQFDGVGMMQQLGASPAINASPQRPVAYVISAVEGFVDSANVKRYAELAGPAIERFGGRFIVSNTEPVLVEGETSLRHLSMVEFPSLEDARAWYDSSDNVEARALTPAAFRGRVLMFARAAEVAE